MKKVFAVCLVLFVLCLSGCARKPYSFKQPINDIKSIEIVSAENSLNYTVIKTLSEVEKAKFMEKFQTIEFFTCIGDPPSVYGLSLKITYNNNDYEMICEYICEYVEKGIVQYRCERCDEDKFNELVNCFLDSSQQ